MKTQPSSESLKMPLGLLYISILANLGIKSKYDGFEINPCCVPDPNHPECLEVCDEDYPAIVCWSVYGHLPEGGVESLTDCESKEQALMIIDALDLSLISDNDFQEQYKKWSIDSAKKLANPLDGLTLEPSKGVSDGDGRIYQGIVCDENTHKTQQILLDMPSLNCCFYLGNVYHGEDLERVYSVDEEHGEDDDEVYGVYIGANVYKVECKNGIPDLFIPSTPLGNFWKYLEGGYCIQGEICKYTKYFDALIEKTLEFQLKSGN